MNREILYDAITELDDRLVEEAGTYRFAKRPKGLLRFAALAAALVLTVGVFRLLPFIGFGGSAGGGGDTEGGAGVMDEENALLYMSYAGPVLPLSAEEEVPLGVERALNFDFSPYRPDADRGRSRSEAIVTDTYTLINRTNFDRTVTLLYPFAAAMTDPATTLPTLTADGVPMEAEWVSGPYSGGSVDTSGNPEGEALNLRELSGWEAYRALLADGSYRATAFSETPVLDQPVTVYRVYDITAPEADDDTMPNPTLNMVFSMDYSKTGVLSYGCNGGSINSAVSQMQRHIGGLGGPRGKE
ncbi:MAG: hypothetical protein IJF59_05825, partial [Clostridia bacterium]|nr:hypothetical protein [Clostridia bacterium]